MEFNYILFLFYAILLFVNFFIIFSIFGSFILFLMKKINKKGFPQKFNFWATIFISFGIGISIYISYCFLLKFFNFYNIFSAYLIFIFIDLVFIGGYYVKNKNLILKFIRNKTSPKLLIEKIIRNKSLIFAFSVIVILGLWLNWNVITESVGLIRYDPYFWLEPIYYLSCNGVFFEKHLGFHYPMGYVIYNAAIFFPFNDKLFIYFFMKFAPLIYFFLYMFIALLITKKLLRKNYLISITLSLLLISGNFVSRNLLNIPSSIASFLILISFLLIIFNFPIWIWGSIIGGIFLIHPLSSIYLGLGLFIYIIVDSFIKFNGLQILRRIILLNMNFFFFVVINILPYLINFKVEKIIDSIIFNLRGIIFPRNNYFLMICIKKYLSIFFLLSKNLSISNLFNLLEISKHPLAFLFILSIIGSINIFNEIFIKKKPIKYPLFFVICIILILILNLIPFFFPSFWFLGRYGERVFESYAFPVVLMSTFCIRWIISIFKKLINYLNRKYYKFIYLSRSILNKFNSNKLKKTESAILLLIAINISVILNSRSTLFYEYYYDDDIVNIYLFIREISQSNEKIYRPYLEVNLIDNILYNMNIIEYDDLITKKKFYHSIKENNISFVIIENKNFDKFYSTDLEKITKRTIELDNFTLLIINSSQNENLKEW